MAGLWSDTHDYESVSDYESKYLSNAIYNLYEDLAVQKEEIESLKAQLGQHKEATQVPVDDECEIHDSVMVSRKSLCGLTEVYYNPELLEGEK